MQSFSIPSNESLATTTQDYSKERALDARRESESVAARPISLQHLTTRSNECLCHSPLQCVTCLNKKSVIYGESDTTIGKEHKRSAKNERPCANCPTMLSWQARSVFCVDCRANIMNRRRDERFKKHQRPRCLTPGCDSRTRIGNILYCSNCLYECDDAAMWTEARARRFDELRAETHLALCVRRQEGSPIAESNARGSSDVARDASV